MGDKKVRNGGEEGSALPGFDSFQDMISHAHYKLAFQNSTLFSQHNSFPMIFHQSLSHTLPISANFSFDLAV